jgi:predicted dehydrogenase
MSWSEPATPFAGRPAAACLMRFSKGVVVSYRGTWISHGPDTVWGADWRIDGSDKAALGTFRGNRGDRRGEDRVRLYKTAETSSTAALVETPLTDRAGALGGFVDWVRTGEAADGLSTGRDNVRSLALMHAAIRSAAEGGRLVSIEEVMP